MLETVKARLHQAREWLLDYAYLVTLGAMIAVIAGTALYTDRLRSQPNVQAAAPAQEVAPSPAPTAVPSPLPTLSPLRMPALTGAVRPVSGGQVRGFSAEPVFWQGLDCWQAHPAADLAAESGETAVCMRDGVVLSCVRDELWGWSVEIRQTDESVCTYAGLSCVLVQAGQTVARGQALGDVLARIPAESELGPHIHLSLARDGQWVDPASTLPEASFFCDSLKKELPKYIQ